MATQTSSGSSSDSEDLVGATACAGGESADPLRKLAEKNKCELMFELRNLRLGERPVTGQDSRQRLNEFFSKRIEVAEITQNNPTAPSNVDDTALHRPEQTVIEVTTLVERRPVSSILSSTAFRRQLERVVRSNINSLINTPISSSASSTPRSTPSLSSSSSSVAPSTSAPERPALHVPQQSLNDQRINAPQNVPQPRTNRQNHAPVNNQQFQSNRQGVPPPPPPPAIPQENDLMNASYVPLDMTVGSSVYREGLREDITELVHRQLVSTTLESDFRGTLENTIEQHLRATGVDGERVQRFIQGIASEPHIRNDFSDLGINVGPIIGDDSDTVSVISATTHSVPYAQSNRALRNELKGLKSQMEEMKNMMKLSFELQMDIQRSIRQEVAAALSHVMAENFTPPTPPGPVQEGKCVICLDKDSDSVFYQCGHLCCCTACGMDLKLQGLKCPVCRAPIKDLIRVYKSGHKD